MAEEDSLLELWARNICPNCGQQIPAGKRVGSGQKSKAVSVVWTVTPAFTNMK